MKKMQRTQRPIQDGGFYEVICFHMGKIELRVAKGSKASPVASAAAASRSAIPHARMRIRRPYRHVDGGGNRASGL